MLPQEHTMPTHYSRMYAAPDDLQAMIELLVAVRPRSRVAEYPGIVDVQELLGLHDVRTNTRLWFNGKDHLVGWAFVDSFDNLRFEFDPQVEHDIENEIVAWGIECVQRKPRTTDEAVHVDASCAEDDQARINFFERHGFERQTSRVLHMARPLATPIAAPTLPPGFTIRSVTGIEEAQALAALHRGAFRTQHMTKERRLSIMTTPEYDPQLDLVAVAPDRELAAYCMVSISADENSRTGRNDGYTDPVATHARFQRMGLARALVLTGLGLLRERGMDTAKLSTSSENTAMQHTARSVGFEVESTTLWFSKPVKVS